MVESLVIKTADNVDVKTVIKTPNANIKGCIVLCHGITVDKNENGKFISMTDILCSAGYKVVRFDFRGHGESTYPSERMTIKGEVKDLEAVANYSLNGFDNIGLLSVSFGAGACIFYTVSNQDKVKSLVLWNPVLDYKKTFLKPILPWGKSFFNPEGYKELNKKGYITVPGSDFKIGKELIDEFHNITPFKEFCSVKCPTLTIHGTVDTKVPFEISKKYGIPNSQSKFISVNTKHGFGDKKKFVYEKTLEWFNITMGSN